MAQTRAFRHAFTVIELLVVILIIAALIALLVPLSSSAMLAARVSGTIQRTQAIMVGLQGTDAGEGRSTARLQRAAGLGGVLRFDYPNGNLQRTEGAWLDYGQPHHLRFPCGQQRLRFDPSTGARLNPDGDPAIFALASMNPSRSFELLTAAGILPSTGGDSAYGGDRSANAAWNDRWGNPLVVAYALYQYGPQDPAAPPNGWFDNEWRQVNERYGRTSSLLVSIGSAGPTGAGFDPAPFAVAATRPATLQGMWANIDQVANRDDAGAVLWRVDPTAAPPVNAVVSPPWTGARRGKHADGRICVLTLPVELH